MALENSGNFFLLLCDHPGSGVEMGWATELQAKKIVVWVFCTWEELLTDLQILGCELHKKCVWQTGSPGPAVAPQTP